MDEIVEMAAKRDPRDEKMDRLYDLLSAYRMAFALINLPMKIKILEAMKETECEGAALEIERDFGENFAVGLRRAYEVNGR